MPVKTQSAKRKLAPKRSGRAAAKPAKIDGSMQKTVVATIREQVEKRLAKNVEKASLADYIRLVQLEKELQPTEAKEIKATWVKPKAARKKKQTEEPNSEK
jgi:hypothetical protein